MHRSLALEGIAARQERHVHKGSQARAVVVAGGFYRPPAQIVAEVTSSVAGGAGIDSGFAC